MSCMNGCFQTPAYNNMSLVDVTNYYYFNVFFCYCFHRTAVNSQSGVKTPAAGLFTGQ